MSRIIFVLQEKGGAGKSTLAIHLAHYLRSIGHSFLLADLDFEKRLFGRYDPECKAYSPDATMLEARDSNVLDLVYLMRHGSNILIDCGANTLGCWEVLFQVEPTLLGDLEAMGAKITLIVPVSSNPDTQDSFPRYSLPNFFGPRVTKLLATIGTEVRQSRGFPPYKEELTLTVPCLPKCLAELIDSVAKPAGIVAQMDPAELDFPIGFARDADKQFTEQFSRMIDHLKP